MNKTGYIVVDIGSSGIKGALYIKGGKLITTVHSDYIYLRNTPPYVEIDSGELIKAVLKCICPLVSEAGGNGIEVEGMSFSSQLGLVGLDSDLMPATPVITWADNRAEHEAEELIAIFGSRLQEKICRKVTGETPSAKIMWLKNNLPEVFKQAKYYVSIKDMIIAAFTGKLITDQTHACYTGLYSVKEGAWAEELAEAAGISLDQLPPVKAGNEVAGNLLTMMADVTGLKSGIPVINGGPDGTLGCLGCGIRPGVAADIVGTTDVIFTCIEEFKSDGVGNIITNRDVLSGRWIIGGPLSITGGMVAWLMRVIGEKETYDSIENKAIKLGPGSDGVMCIPAMTGTRAPRWDSNMRSAFVGITQEHDIHHLYRAALEGSSYMAYQMISCLKAMDIKIGEILMGGGGANSKLWGEIRAGMFNIPLRRVSNPNATLTGLEYLCELSMDPTFHINEQEDSIEETITVDPSNHEQYSQLCTQYDKLYDALVKVF